MRGSMRLHGYSYYHSSESDTHYRPACSQDDTLIVVILTIAYYRVLLSSCIRVDPALKIDYEYRF